MLHRRGFLSGLMGIIAAPAIVRASSLMPVRGIVMAVATGYDDPLHGEWVRCFDFFDGVFWYRTWLEGDKLTSEVVASGDIFFRASEHIVLPVKP